MTRLYGRVPQRTVIAVDFDGTCVTHEYPKVGSDVALAKDVLALLNAAGFDLILYTMRSGKELQDAVKWFKTNNIPLLGVNRNPDQDAWTSSPKVYANLYIDDAALGAPLVYPGGGARPHVDWLPCLAKLMSMYPIVSSTLPNFPELHSRWMEWVATKDM